MVENETAAKPATRRANELGPIGAYVAANLKSLRLSLPLTTEQLAERMASLGRPMHANAITKMEKQQRRVDVDDLVALAIALETRPDALLLPRTIVGEVQLAEPLSVSAIDAWQWANGNRPYDLPKDDDGRVYHEFQNRAQPLGMGNYRYKPEELGPGVWHEGKFHPMTEGDTSGEHRETPER